MERKLCTRNRIIFYVQYVDKIAGMWLGDGIRKQHDRGLIPSYHHTCSPSMSLFLVCRSSLRVPCLPSTVLTRRAMMSGLPKGHASTTSPALPNSPPVSIPAEHISMSPDAAAPQTAAPPPPVPKLAKPRPKIRSTKAALTIVSSR